MEQLPLKREEGDTHGGAVNNVEQVTLGGR